MNCIHNSDPTICKVCERKRLHPEVLIWVRYWYKQRKNFVINMGHIKPEQLVILFDYENHT